MPKVFRRHENKQAWEYFQSPELSRRAAIIRHFTDCIMVFHSPDEAAAHHEQKFRMR